MDYLNVLLERNILSITHILMHIPCYTCTRLSLRCIPRRELLMYVHVQIYEKKITICFSKWF